jgi:hypothetical protein
LHTNPLILISRTRATTHFYAWWVCWSRLSVRNVTTKQMISIFTLWTFHLYITTFQQYQLYIGGHHGHDRIVAGLTTTYAISAYHHWFCEFESRPGRGVQHYVIEFVSDLWQVVFSQLKRYSRAACGSSLSVTEGCC